MIPKIDGSTMITTAKGAKLRKGPKQCKFYGLATLGIRSESKVHNIPNYGINPTCPLLSSSVKTHFQFNTFLDSVRWSRKISTRARTSSRTTQQWRPRSRNVWSLYWYLCSWSRRRSRAQTPPLSSLTRRLLSPGSNPVSNVSRSPSISTTKDLRMFPSIPSFLNSPSSDRYCFFWIWDVVLIILFIYGDWFR